MALLICFLGGPSPRSPAVDEAAVFLLVVLSMAYVARGIVEHFAIVVLAYLHLAIPAPVPASATTASSVCLWWFVALVFMLAFLWFIVVAVQLAAFFYLGGIGQGFSWNALH
ncbi:unnamed protein product [Alopecurus aequalis]